ncbi:MAG: hypothetical protein HZA54_10720 [Planctomycetes bacterium]|nr:hypothetical protein [Planctomycetota bacterium]
MFRWSALAIALLACAVLGWVVFDLRRDLKRTTETVNQNLPRILEHTQKTTQVLANLSEDVRALRDLAGLADGAGGAVRDPSLVRYADDVLDRIEASGAQIGLAKKVFGSGLKDLLPAAEWVRGARKEALWLAFRATSREELLRGIGQNMYGSKWFIQAAGKEPVELETWVREGEGAATEGGSREGAPGAATPR